ncbi:MAG: anthranilate synthase component I family protein [Acidobacteriota bacterium]
MNFSEFESKAGKYNVIPLTRTLPADTLTPVGLYLAGRDGYRDSFLFESVEGEFRVARYSILGFGSSERLISKGPETVLVREGKCTSAGPSIADALKDRLRGFHPAFFEERPPFAGGYVGYLGYGCAARANGVSFRAEQDGFPDAELGRFDDLLVYDHARSRLLLVANALLEEGTYLEKAYRSTLSRLDALEALAGRAVPSQVGRCLSSREAGNDPGGDSFEAGVKAAKAHIREGDIYQVVLSVRQDFRFKGDPFDVYRRLRMDNPSPYHFFVQQQDSAILGASPEMLVRVTGRRVEVRPIAGTRPRGRDVEEDGDLRLELLEDQKENAEHTMLVDLGRNDVGRVSEYGSVKVTSFKEIENYSHVMHMVSSVEGRLREGMHPVDAFFAGFPAGTVSGAPKIRAMQLIADLEYRPRGVYSGAIGYFDYAGNLDTCIAIRAAFVRGGMIQVQAGAGIVADSEPDREYAECLHKMAAVRAAVDGTGGWQ